jgi:hypothetical protein
VQNPHKHYAINKTLNTKQVPSVVANIYYEPGAPKNSIFFHTAGSRSTKCSTQCINDMCNQAPPVTITANGTLAKCSQWFVGNIPG